LPLYQLLFHVIKLVPPELAGIERLPERTRTDTGRILRMDGPAP